MVNLKNGAFLVTIHTFWNELSTQKPLKLTLPSNQSFRNRPQSSKIRIVLFLRHMVEISKTALIYLFIFLSFKYESHHRPKDLSKEAKVEKIDNENKELYNRLTKINSTSIKPSLGPLKLDNR